MWLRGENADPPAIRDRISVWTDGGVRDPILFVDRCYVVGQGQASELGETKAYLKPLEAGEVPLVFE